MKWPGNRFGRRVKQLGKNQSIGKVLAAGVFGLALALLVGTTNAEETKSAPPPKEPKQGISAAYPFDSNYVEVKGSKIHYVDIGSGDPILFLHGNPTYSYIWRNIIPHLVAQGRCIALDLIGMGKSDHPDIDYKFVDHIEYIDGFIEKLGLKNITLVLHDWGSGIGFHYASKHPDNVKGIAFLESMLMPMPDWSAFDAEGEKTFRAFRTPDVGWDMIVNQNVFIEGILPGLILRKLSDEEMNFYRAPYLKPENRKAVWAWPNQLSIEGEPKDVTEIINAYQKWLMKTDIPKLMFTATPGLLIQAPVVEWAEKNLKNLTVVNVGPGLHYLQEDHPHEIGWALAKWYSSIK